MDRTQLFGALKGSLSADQNQSVIREPPQSSQFVACLDPLSEALMAPDYRFGTSSGLFLGEEAKPIPSFIMKRAKFPFLATQSRKCS